MQEEGDSDTHIIVEYGQGRVCTKAEPGQAPEYAPLHHYARRRRGALALARLKPAENPSQSGEQGQEDNDAGVCSLIGASSPLKGE